MSRRRDLVRHPCGSFATLVTGGLKTAPAFLLEALVKKWWFLILPIIVFVVSCCDLWTTIYFDRTYGGFEEANPVALYIWDNLGDVGLGAFKLVVTLLSCICTGWVLRTKSYPWRAAVSVFGLVVCSLLMGWWIFWFFVKQTCFSFV